ncbi:hypothetical protein [Longirhabdus pacifica]|uniref:hypothetical protein n=1 Tax=Longirhabdus pacifica TaxID=2305227 RepID=UPI001008CC96|nr:hypothetical protein [Longirhabdus pacifica]
MAKSNRGKPLRQLFARGRGTCPICKRTRIKLLYEIKGEDGNNMKVCKICSKKNHGVSKK